MANGFGAVDATDAGTLSLLYGGLGVGGINRGYSEGYVFGSPAANAVRTEAVSDRVSDQGNFTRDFLASNNQADRIAVAELARSQADATTRAEIGAGFNRVTDNQMQSSINDLQQVINAERERADVRVETIDRINNVNDRLSDCCCQIQLNQQRDTATILARMNEINTDNIRDERNKLQSQLQTQTLLAAMNNISPAPPTTCL